jgi:DNA-binding transcriptional LysR family regulator
MREQISGDVEVRHFNAFLAVATELNFTRAANRLCMSQPALSRCVAQMERLLGERLVYRTRQQVSLTPAGERLLPHARMVLESLRNAVRAAHGEAARLRVGFTTDYSFAEIPVIVQAFENSYSNIDVDLICLDKQFNGLVSGLCDLEFVRGSRPGPNVGSTLLFQEPRVAALPCDHRLAGKAEIKMEDISEEPFVVVGNMPSLDLAPLGLANASIISVDSIDAWMIAIGAGRGIGITDKSVADFHKHSRVWFAELQDGPLASVWAAWPINTHRTEIDILIRIALEVTKGRADGDVAR